MTKEEWKYRVEQAKDKTPSTGAFIWFVPCLFVLAWVCRDDTYVAQRHHATVETSITLLGWRIL